MKTCIAEIGLRFTHKIHELEFDKYNLTSRMHFSQVNDQAVVAFHSSVPHLYKRQNPPEMRTLTVAVASSSFFQTELMLLW